MGCDKALTKEFFSLWNDNCQWNWQYYRQKPSSLLYSIFQSFIGLWVKKVHRNKSACCSTTCPRKGSLLRIQWNSFNSTSTADSRAHKCLQTVSGIILDWLQPKLQFLSYLLKKIFLGNRLLKKIYPVLLTMNPLLCLQDLSYISSYWFSNFWGWWGTKLLLDEHWAKNVWRENILTPIYVNGLQSEFWYMLSGLEI